QTNPVVVENGVFCVNTLGDGGAEIADIFAGRTGIAGGDRFARGDWLTLSTGSPVLASAVIAFDCRIVEVRSVGGHNVFFGAVETVRAGPNGPALVYHDRAYKRVGNRFQSAAQLLQNWRRYRGEFRTRNRPFCVATFCGSTR